MVSKLLCIHLGGVPRHAAIIGAAVYRPEIVGQHPQRLRKIKICGRSACPNGVTIIRRDHDAAQHRDLRTCLTETDIRTKFITPAIVPT